MIRLAKMDFKLTTLVLSVFMMDLAAASGQSRTTVSLSGYEEWGRVTICIAQFRKLSCNKKNMLSVNIIFTAQDANKCCKAVFLCRLTCSPRPVLLSQVSLPCESVLAT